MKRAIIIVYFLLLSCFACEKGEELFCYSCSTSVTTQVSWQDGMHFRLGYPSTSTYIRTICDITEQEAELYSLSATDSTVVEDGVVWVHVSKKTICTKE